MILLLTASFVLQLFFYMRFDSVIKDNDDKNGMLEQELLVSITLYLHTVIEILFNIVALVYLI